MGLVVAILQLARDVIQVAAKNRPEMFKYFVHGSGHAAVELRTLDRLERADLLVLAPVLERKQMRGKDFKAIGQEPWSSGYEKRLTFRRSWVRIPAPYTGWKFFHIYLL